VQDVRLAFGGMAPTPTRAYASEQALLGRVFDHVSVDEAISSLDKDLRPISDWRGSAAYRRTLAANLLRKLSLRLAEPAELCEVDQL
jgi:xanthine dehydrogenase small subunit